MCFQWAHCCCICYLGALSFCDQQLSDCVIQHSNFQVKKERYETKHGNANPNPKLERKDVGNTCPMSWVCHSTGPSTEDLSYLLVSARGQCSWVQRGSRVFLHIAISCIAFNSCWVFCSILMVRVLVRSQRVTDSAYHSRSEVWKISNCTWSESSTSVRAVAHDEFMI